MNEKQTKNRVFRLFFAKDANTRRITVVLAKAFWSLLLLLHITALVQYGKATLMAVWGTPSNTDTLAPTLAPDVWGIGRWLLGCDTFIDTFVYFLFFGMALIATAVPLLLVAFFFIMLITDGAE
jgi:hypothetical protein